MNVAQIVMLAVTGVILVTPWDSLPRVAPRIYWYFPTRWLVLDRFDNVEKNFPFRKQRSDLGIALPVGLRDEGVRRIEGSAWRSAGGDPWRDAGVAMR